MTTTEATPDKRALRPRPEAIVADSLWGTTELLAYFRCGTTKLAALKKEAGFPKPVMLGGMARYVPDQVRAFVLAKLPQQPEGGADA